MRIFILGLVAVVGHVAPSSAQNVAPDDRPKPYVLKQTRTQKEIAELQALHRYVDGLLYLHDDRFSEALKAFDEAARLDPNAPDIIKEQVPILIALDRYADALAACKKVVGLDPDDYRLWFVAAKLHKARADYPSAIAALESGLKSTALKEHPEAAQHLFVELGSLYEGRDQYGPAADAFNKAIAILEHPDQVAERGHVPREAVLARAGETYEKIGRLYHKAKQLDEAISALQKAQERAPARAAMISFQLAQICGEKSDFAAAIKHVDAYLRTQPLSIDPYELKLRLLRRLKATDAIVPWLEEAAGRERFNNALQLLYAQECVAAKLPKKAEAVYQKLADDSPSAELYRGLFNIYKDEGPAGMARILGMLDKVMDKHAREDGPAPIGTTQTARAMVAALRGDAPLAMKLVEAAGTAKAELKFDTVFFLAMLADGNHKNEEAERFYRRCLADKNVSPAGEPALYAGLLRALAGARKHEASVAVCEDGLKSAKGPLALLFHKELARAQASLHHYDDALKTTEKGLQLADGDVRLLFDILRVRILLMAERFADAEKACTALLKKYERPAEAVELRYLLSNIYSAAKQQVKAEEQLALILTLDPDSATVNNDLGYLWAEQGKNLEAAERMIRKALDLDRSQRRRNPDLTPVEDKDNAAYVDSLGWVLYRRGQIDEARKELERATTLGDGDDPVIYDHLGDVYHRLDLHRESIRSWQRAIELYDHGVRGKDDERVREIRRKIGDAKELIGG